jgi:hypothetical protein
MSGGADSYDQGQNGDQHATLLSTAANVSPMTSSQMGLIAMTKSLLIVATMVVCLVAMTTAADAQWYHWHHWHHWRHWHRHHWHWHHWHHWY